eukprot:CAMPEP_0184855282 /NCGR_PEP_ID=MMETSP0580-20130426/576_1 /TAXON_ID=1118495 /ORGANISM="Dactyliosolen fragilissimus" /LENGTH=565 /DNA_ID=CAMNT_0027349757 /DNA_START=342 /DNA_END=2039 /DNA_ORIENTATION=-
MSRVSYARIPADSETDYGRMDFTSATSTTTSRMEYGTNSTAIATGMVTPPSESYFDDNDTNFCRINTNCGNMCVKSTNDSTSTNSSPGPGLNRLAPKAYSIATKPQYDKSFANGRNKCKNFSWSQKKNEINYIFKTPRGRTVSVSVSKNVSYDTFLRLLLEKAAVEDLKHKQQEEQEENQQLCDKIGGDCGFGGDSLRKRSLNQSLDIVEEQEPSNGTFSFQKGIFHNKTISSSDNPCISQGKDKPKHSLKNDNVSNIAFVSHNGKILGRSEFDTLTKRGKASSNSFYVPKKDDIPQTTPIKDHHISLHLRLRGGMTDRQNRVGSKFGGGGQSSAQQAERERKERLRQLALETIDLAKDPYLMRNHLGTYECKLCLTLHTNEGNYLAHTQGKKHQANLAKRAAMEAKMKGLTQDGVGPLLSETSLAASAAAAAKRAPRVKIGRPGYEVSKSRDPLTHQRCLSFSLHFPDLSSDIQPRHRFMSCYEQRVDSPPDRRYQYLLIAAEPYETVAFKIPNEKIDKGEGRFVSYWDKDEKRFTLTCYFMDEDNSTLHASSTADERQMVSAD